MTLRCGEKKEYLPPPEYAFTAKVQCGFCGKSYRHKNNNAGSAYSKGIWRCQTYERQGVAVCQGRGIFDEVLEPLFIIAYNEFIATKNKFVVKTDNTAAKDKLLEDERKLMSLKARGLISLDDYKEESEKMLAEIKTLDAIIKREANKTLRKRYKIKKNRHDCGYPMSVLRKKHHCSSSVVYSSCSKKNLEIKAPRQNSVSKLEPYRETIEIWILENALGYLRRNLLVPLPTIVDFEQFNRDLIIESEKQTDRLHYRKTFRIPNRFSEDIKFFLPLPAVKFVCKSRYICKVDNIGCARINKNKAYFVDPKYKGSYVNAVQSYGNCVITAEDGTVLYDGKRLYRRELQENIDLGSILSIIAKYPNSIAALPIVRSLPRSVQLFIATALPNELEQFVRNMSMICKMSNMQKTALVADVCATERKFSKKDFTRIYEALE